MSVVWREQTEVRRHLGRRPVRFTAELKRLLGEHTSAQWRAVDSLGFRRPALVGRPRPGC